MGHINKYLIKILIILSRSYYKNNNKPKNILSLTSDDVHSDVSHAAHAGVTGVLAGVSDQGSVEHLGQHKRLMTLSGYICLLPDWTP